MLNVLPSQHHFPGLAGVIRGGKIGNPAGSLPGLAGEVWGAICTVLSVVARAWAALHLAAESPAGPKHPKSGIQT